MATTKLGMLVGCALGASLFMITSAASAQIVATESFPYAAGGAPGNALGLGPGWAGAWTANGTLVTAPGLSYPGVSSFGNAIGGTPGSAATRLLATPVGGSGGFVVIRVLINSPLAGTQASQATVGNTNGITDGHFIFGDLPQLDVGAENWGLQTASFRCYSNKPVLAGVTTLLVARIDFDPSTANDRMRMWVDPPTPVSLTTLMATTTDIDVTLSNVNQLSGLFWQTQQGQILDEISISSGSLANFSGTPVTTGPCY